MLRFSDLSRDVCLLLCVCSEQPQVHFRIRNRQTGLMMAVTGDLDDIKLMRIQETEESGELDQIWFYQNGRLHCKVPHTTLACRGLQDNRFLKVSNQNLARQLLCGFKRPLPDSPC